MSTWRNFIAGRNIWSVDKLLVQDGQLNYFLFPHKIKIGIHSKKLMRTFVLILIRFFFLK